MKRSKVNRKKAGTMKHKEPCYCLYCESNRIDQYFKKKYPKWHKFSPTKQNLIIHGIIEP